MSQLVKTKRQANFKGFKRFGAFKGLVEQKNVVFNSFVVNWAFFGTRGSLKLAHSCQKKPNSHTNSLNKLLLQFKFIKTIFFYQVLTKYIVNCKKKEKIIRNLYVCTWDINFDENCI
jgi:hypothetical protein